MRRLPAIAALLLLFLTVQLAGFVHGFAHGLGPASAHGAGAYVAAGHAGATSPAGAGIVAPDTRATAASEPAGDDGKPETGNCDKCFLFAHLGAAAAARLPAVDAGLGRHASPIAVLRVAVQAVVLRARSRGPPNSF